MFGKPNETLSVEPIMVSGDHAVADWTQGEMGGRALLRRPVGQKVHRTFCLTDRTRRGWRTYSEADVERLSRALAFKAMGFSLSQIAGLLDAEPAVLEAALAAQELYLLRRRAEVDAVLAELRKARSRRAPPVGLAA